MRSKRVAFDVVTNVIGLAMGAVGIGFAVKDQFSGSESYKAELQEIAKLLRSIDTKMDSLVHLTKVNDVINEYNKHVKKIDVLKFKIESYVNAPKNSIAQKRLKESCQNNKME